MKCKFVVGQKVVCIADGWADTFPVSMIPYSKCPLMKGKIYTIEMIVPYFDYVMLWLKGFPGHQFDHSGFRPLQERPKEADTDISVFEPLLKVRIVETVEH